MGDPSESSSPDDEEEDGSGSGNVPNELVSADGLSLEELVDEAVTSRGDSIQWDDELTPNEEP